MKILFNFDSNFSQDWENIQDLIADDQLFDDSIGRSLENNRLRSPKILVRNLSHKVNNMI